MLLAVSGSLGSEELTALQGQQSPSHFPVCLCQGHAGPAQAPLGPSPTAMLVGWQLGEKVKSTPATCLPLPSCQLHCWSPFPQTSSPCPNCLPCSYWLRGFHSLLNASPLPAHCWPCPHPARRLGFPPLPSYLPAFPPPPTLPLSLSLTPDTG